MKNGRKAIICFAKRLEDFAPITETPDNPDMPIYVYARGDLHVNLIESIRNELTKRILELLPKAETDLKQS